MTLEHIHFEHPGDDKAHKTKIAVLLGVTLPWLGLWPLGKLIPALQTYELVFFVSLVALGAGAGAWTVRRHGEHACVLLMVAVVLVSVAAGFSFHGIREARLAPLRERLREYNNLVSLAVSDQGNMPVHVQPKMIAIDFITKNIDDLHVLLPATLRADEPDEIQTVVYLRWDKRAVGQFSGGGTNYARTCEVTVVVLGQPPRCVCVKQIEGPPYDKDGGSSDLYGRMPNREVIEFLASICQ
jgi:hypothetical protein